MTPPKTPSTSKLNAGSISVPRLPRSLATALRIELEINCHMLRAQCPEGSRALLNSLTEPQSHPHRALMVESPTGPRETEMWSIPGEVQHRMSHIHGWHLHLTVSQTVVLSAEYIFLLNTSQIGKRLVLFFRKGNQKPEKLIRSR